MVASINAETLEAQRRLVTIQNLAAVAATELAHADRELQAKVLALLDVRVTVLEQGERLDLQVEGSVAHDLLLNEVKDGAAEGVAFRVVVSAGA